MGASQFRKNTDEEFQNPYAALKQNGISAKVGCSLSHHRFFCTFFYLI